MIEPSNKGKELKGAWIRKKPEKVPAFDVRREKYTFLEARKDFTDPRTSTSNIHAQRKKLQFQEASLDQVSMITYFLSSCMNLLRKQATLYKL